MIIGKYANISQSAIIGPHVKFEVGDGTVIGAGVRILGHGYVKFGDYCKVHDGCFINTADTGAVVFGHNCWFGERTVLDGTGGLYGGNNIGAGIGSHLYTHIAHGDTIEGCRFYSKKEMHIGDDVWFVGQCLVSPIEAGTKSMAMLGSVITKDMLANHIYAGMPAKDITDKVGVPWVDVPVDQKLTKLQAYIDEFCKSNNTTCIVACIDLPRIHDRDPDKTYVSVGSRLYTKTGSIIEHEFMKWLVSYKGRFFPEEK